MGCYSTLDDSERGYFRREVSVEQFFGNTITKVTHTSYPKLVASEVS